MELCTRESCKNTLIESHKCEKCGVVNYCSKECKINDWITSHQYTCGEDNKLGKYLEIENAEISVLGKGAYSEVRLIKHKITGEYYALKQIEKDMIPNSQDLLNEINLHSNLSHKNIINLHES